MPRKKRETRKHTWKGKTQEVAYWKGMKWDKPLTEEMKRMEKETGQKAVWRGEITGTFEYWKYWKEYHESIKKPRGFQKGHAPYRRSKSTSMESIIAAYKHKYGVKRVNTDTKKFKAFAESYS